MGIEAKDMKIRSDRKTLGRQRMVLDLQFSCDLAWLHPFPPFFDVLLEHALGDLHRSGMGGSEPDLAG